MEEKRPSIEEALIKFGETKPTPREFALFCGFNENEAKMLEIFWDPAFINGWYYLSDDVILSNLTDDSSRSAISDFYRRVLCTKEFDENVDYQLVGKTHPVVVKCMNSNSANLRNKGRGSGRKKYYIVTGRTYKRLIIRATTQKGIEARDYYLKVEELADQMRKYIILMHEHLSAKMKEELAEKHVQLLRQEEELKLVTTRLEEQKMVSRQLGTFIATTTKREANERIYIATNDWYAAQGFYKVGGSESQALLKCRRSSYNTARHPDDPMYYVYIIGVHNYKDVEKRLSYLLSGYLVESSKELYAMRFESLVEFVNAAAHAQESLNKMLDDYNTNRLQQDIIAPRIIPPPIELAPPPKKGRGRVRVQLQLPAPTVDQLIASGAPSIDDIVRVDVSTATDEQCTILATQFLQKVIPDFSLDKDIQINWPEQVTPAIREAANKNKCKPRIKEWQKLINKVIRGTAVKLQLRKGKRG
jgi:hypothetical protein